MTKNGTRLVLRDVRNIPNMRLNLISTCKLDDESFCNTFINCKQKLTEGSLVVAKGIKHSKLYVMQAKLSSHIVSTVENDNTSELWHK